MRTNRTNPGLHTPIRTPGQNSYVGSPFALPTLLFVPSCLCVKSPTPPAPPQFRFPTSPCRRSPVASPSQVLDFTLFTPVLRKKQNSFPPDSVKITRTFSAFGHLVPLVPNVDSRSICPALYRSQNPRCTALSRETRNFSRACKLRQTAPFFPVSRRVDSPPFTGLARSNRTAVSQTVKLTKHSSSTRKSTVQ